MTQLNVTQGVQAVVIEATATSVSANAGRTSPAINDYIRNEGLYDIVFTVSHPDTNTQDFTLRPGWENTVPFLFSNLAWIAADGDAAFYCFAHVAPRG